MLDVPVSDKFPAVPYFHFMNSPTLLTLVIFIIKVTIIHKTYNEDRQFNELQSDTGKQICVYRSSLNLIRLNTRGCEN